MPLPSRSGVCVCSAGWTGERCNDFTCPMACSGRGACVNGSCACADGWGGTDCSLGPCPLSCSTHGRCTAGGCECDDGFSGKGCDVPACPHDCSDRGMCYQGQCHCHAPYGGSDCSELHSHLRSGGNMSPPPASSGVTGWVKLALGASSSPSSIGDSGAFSAIVATMMPTALASWTGPCADANGAAIGLTHGGAHVPHDSQCNFRGRCERDSTRCHCFR